MRTLRKFQSTPPRRERQMVCLKSNNQERFQSTPPRRERLEDSDGVTMRTIISIHAPAKGATAPKFIPFTLEQFQSTPPRRERLGIILHLLKITIFQSTPPRRERLNLIEESRQRQQISIHAPAKGATIEFN